MKKKGYSKISYQYFKIYEAEDLLFYCLGYSLKLPIFISQDVDLIISS